MGTYTAEQNGASHSPELFEILDDDYWNSERQRPRRVLGPTRRERWLVGQGLEPVLCCIPARRRHGPPGKMFVWDLLPKDRNPGIRGYVSLAPQAGKRLAKLKSEGGEAGMDGWYLYDGVRGCGCSTTAMTTT